MDEFDNELENNHIDYNEMSEAQEGAENFRASLLEHPGGSEEGIVSNVQKSSLANSPINEDNYRKKEAERAADALRVYRIRQAERMARITGASDASAAYTELLGLDEFPQTPSNLPLDSIDLPGGVLGAFETAISATTKDGLERGQIIFKEDGVISPGREHTGNNTSPGRESGRELWDATSKSVKDRPLLEYHTHPTLSLPVKADFFSLHDIISRISRPLSPLITLVGSDSDIFAILLTAANKPYKNRRQARRELLRKGLDVERVTRTGILEGEGLGVYHVAWNSRDGRSMVDGLTLNRIRPIT